MQWLLGWLGGRPQPYDVHVVDVKNQGVRECERTVACCFQAQIENTEKGSRLGFRMSPALGSGNRFNALYQLRDELRQELDQFIVILSIDRVQAYNELPVDLTFEMLHVFDKDAATEAMAKVADEAYRLATVGGTVGRRRPGAAAATSKKPSTIVIANNNNAPTAHLEPLTDNDDSISSLLEPSSEPAPLDHLSPAQAMGKLDTIAGGVVGGGELGNQAERDNAISLGVIRAGRTPDTTVLQLYRASLDEKKIRLYAGQDNVVADHSVMQPAATVPNLTGTAKERAARPVITSTILPATHALVTFIITECEDLTGGSDDGKNPNFALLATERARSDMQYYRVSQTLLEDARLRILTGIFSRMRYTSLRSCYMGHCYESEAGETALILKVADHFNLKISGGTSAPTVADWKPGDYRPTVSITLRVRYVIVDGVSASAASLYKQRVRLVPATGGGGK